MKKKKQLLIALGALTLLGAGYLLISRGEDEAPALSDPAEAREVFTLTDFAEEEVESMGVENSLGGFTLVRTEEGYLLKDEPAVRLNRQSAASMAYVLCNLKSFEKIEESIESPGDYGLADGGSARLTLNLNEGSPAVVTVGNSTPTGNGFYAMKEGDPAVYLLPSYAVSGLFNSADLLRDRTLPGVDFQNLTRLTIGGERIIDIVPYFPYEALSSTLSTHVMIKPFRRPVAVSAQKYSDSLEALAGSYSIVSFVPEGTDTGLDQARDLYLQDSAGRELTISFGGKTENGQEVYCRISGLDELVTLPAAAASIMDVRPVDMADRFVRLVGIDQVSELKISYLGEEWTGTINWLDEETGEFTYQGEPVDDKAFKKMYQEVLYLLFEGEIPGTFAMEGEPEFTLSYTGDAGSPGVTTAELYNYDRDFYAISIDGFPPEFLIGKYQIEALVSFLREFKG